MAAILLVARLPAAERNAPDGVTGTGPSLRAHPANPHYFEYRGRPILLLATDHHYGAVTIAEFDYLAFLDTLAAHGLNFTRIYPGALPPAWHAPPTILPWPRTPQGKFDLDRWDGAYFERLRGFVSAARAHGIMVDVCLFNGVGDWWQREFGYSPLHPANNLTGEGTADGYAFCSLEVPLLVRRQKEYVAKIVAELNAFDNVLYDLCDEPDAGSNPPADPARFTPWLNAMMTAFTAAEAALPRRHLIAATYATGIQKLELFSAQDRFGWISLEYPSGISLLDRLYPFGKPLAIVETAVYPVQYHSPAGPERGNEIDQSRVEAWEFLVGGGAGFIQLNGHFGLLNGLKDQFPLNPTAQGTSTSALFAQLKVLRKFIEGFDFIRMARCKEIGVQPAGAFVSAIAEPGRQYALYLHHARYGVNRQYYDVVPGHYSHRLAFPTLPPGQYLIEWILPATGAVLRYETFDHPGGPWAVTTPDHALDIAGRLVRTDKPRADSNSPSHSLRPN